MGPVSRLLSVDESNIGVLLNRFLSDEKIYLQEVDFINPDTGDYDREHVLPRDLYSCVIRADDVIPSAEALQITYEQTGGVASCIGAFDRDDCNRMCLLFVPGDSVTVIATVYSPMFEGRLDEQLRRIGIGAGS